MMSPSEPEFRKQVQEWETAKKNERARNRILMGAALAALGGVLAIIAVIWGLISTLSLFDSGFDLDFADRLRDLIVSFALVGVGLGLGALGSGIAFWGLASRPSV